MYEVYLYQILDETSEHLVEPAGSKTEEVEGAALPT